MMQLLVITSEKTNADEHTQINALFANDLSCLHIRKPDFLLDEMRKYIQQIDKNFHNRIVIHSHHQLADEFNLQGVHYPSAYRNEIKPQSFYDHRHMWREKEKTWSTSFHTGDNFHCSSLFDYAFYSPVGNSISKVGHNAAEPAQMVSDIQEIKTDVIALGGISPAMIKELPLDLFAGVAALGWIWEKGNDPVHQFNVLKETCHVTAPI